MARRMRGQEILLEWGDGPLTVSRRALLYRGSDQKFRKMIHALVGYANSVLEARDCYAALLGISGVQYEILMVIYRLHGKEPCSTTEVAVQVHRTLALITIEVDKLIAKGFVKKRRDPKDRRRALLAVTKAGVDRLERIVPMQRELNDTLFDTLTAQEFASLCKLYEKLPASGERAAAKAILYKSDARKRRQILSKG